MNSKTDRRNAYSKKLLDPRWQRRRLEILQRDNWQCQICHNEEATLNVHHRWYVGEPWEAPDAALVTLCEDCHKQESDTRMEAQDQLLKSLKRVLWSHDFIHLERLMLKMAKCEAMEVQLTALAWFLSDPEHVSKIIQRFYANDKPLPADWSINLLRRPSDVPYVEFQKP